MSAVPAAAQLVDGRYRLGEILGTGGSGVVRRAHDERLRRDVAIKLFHPGSADQDRQSSELALMASLAHPALVRMYDGGPTTDANGTPSSYLVMEFVTGPTLQRALAEGALSQAEVAAIGAALASALAYLHSRGVVHRDVKPANVLLPLDDEVPAKLGDFGIARILDGARVTATGMTVGTANYLSPEQALGHPVTQASDVYSLGLVLLEALTGQVTYSGGGVVAALARLDRPAVVPDTLGPVWTSLLPAMLDRDPAARPDALQVRRRLAEVQTGAARPAAVSAGGTVGSVPNQSTAVIASPARHRAPETWPDDYLLTGASSRRRMTPAVVLGLMGSAAAAIVAGVFIATTAAPAVDAPAAPPDPSVSTGVTPAAAPRSTSTGTPVARLAERSSAPPETTVRQAVAPGTRSRTSAAPSRTPATRTRTARTQSRPTKATTGGPGKTKHDHSKAKGTKHAGK